MENLDKFILIIVVSFEQTAMSPANQLPNSKIKPSHSKSYHEDDVVTAAHEQSCGQENNNIFVEVEYEMDQNEHFFVIVVEFIGSSQGILLTVPPNLPVNQRHQRLPVQFVASNHGQVRPDLPLDVNKTGQTKSQHCFV